MGQGYQERDYEIIDYKLYQLDDSMRFLRGPKPEGLKNREFFMCLGAAQTFGCFTENPFPSLLSKKLKLNVLNAGTAGAGPLFFLKHKHYLDLANTSRFVIIQVMSGRSEDNRYFESPLGRGMVIRRSDGKKMMAEKAYNELLETSMQETVTELIEETKRNYVEHMLEMIKLIKVPKILFWFSVRNPDYGPTFENAQSLFGKYPQLIDEEMLKQMVPHVDYFVKCISSKGLPQELFSRFTGEKTTYVNEPAGPIRKQYNYYYPSPEMHQAAAKALYPECQKVLSSKTTLFTDIVLFLKKYNLWNNK